MAVDQLKLTRGAALGDRITIPRPPHRLDRVHPHREQRLRLGRRPPRRDGCLQPVGVVAHDDPAAPPLRGSA